MAEDTLLAREVSEAREIEKATLVRLYHRWARLAEQCERKAETSGAFFAPDAKLWTGQARGYADCAADLKALLGLG